MPGEFLPARVTSPARNLSNGVQTVQGGLSVPLTFRDAHGFRQMTADGRALALVAEGNDKSVRRS